MFENGVTVTFNAEGGKLNGMDKWIEEIAEENGAWNINLADFVPEREGYDFLGWGVSSSAADTTVLSVDDLASSDAALRRMQFSSVNGGTDYTLYAKWQNATGFDYLYDEDTKELTISNDQGMNVFYEAMTEKQLKEVEKLVMLEGVSDLGSFDYSVMTSLKTLVISPGIKRITDGRFQNMPSLEQVVIPASVTGIFNSAFADCPKLKTVSFEDNEADPIKSADNLSIEENAFAHCDISEIHFPRQLYSLGSRVFEGCPLTDVYFQEARFSSSQYINLADTNYSAYGSFNLAGAAVKLHFPESIADAYKEKVIPNYAQIINPPEDFIRYPVSVNGETFHSQRLEIPCGEGYAAFDPLTMTLTLHDADITVGNSVGYAGFNQDYHTGISAACDSLTIILEGSNTLSGEKGGAYYDSEQGQWAQKQWGAYGIEVLGDLTITGGGSLTMETAEGESPRLMKAKNLTIKNTEVNASGSDVEPSGDMLTEDSVFTFGNLTINDNITATFRNSTVAMKGKMTVYSTLARVIFDGGDFTGETADQYTSDLFYSYGDTSLISYRGDTGILSGK